VPGSSAASRLRRVETIFVDADDCPVKDEIYRVARMLNPV
jgi:hypothetical protein